MAATNKDPYLGTLFAERFLVLDKLGEGSMGTVYEARELGVSRPVALKLIHPHLAVHPRILDRFRREMAITTRMDTPNCVEVYDYGQAPGGELYLAMELIKGRPLSDAIHEAGRLSAQRAAKIAIQVCRALATAHDANIIHRDLKPDNIMLTEQGEQLDFVKILDFGVARAIDSDAEQDSTFKTMTRAGSPLGTLPYMSPQQVACEALDHRTDLYSLGVVLYEMLSGKPPFDCRTRKQALNDHLLKQAPKLSSVVPDVPPALEALVHALLAKEPDERPPTAGAVIEQLRAAVPPAEHPFAAKDDAGGPTIVPDDGEDRRRAPGEPLPPPPSFVPEAPAAPAAPKRPLPSPLQPVPLQALPPLPEGAGNSTMVPDAEEENTLLLPPISHLKDVSTPSGRVQNLARMQLSVDAETPPTPTPLPRARTQPDDVPEPDEERQEAPVKLVAEEVAGKPNMALLLTVGAGLVLLSAALGAGLMWVLLR